MNNITWIDPDLEELFGWDSSFKKTQQIKLAKQIALDLTLEPNKAYLLDKNKWLAGQDKHGFTSKQLEKIFNEILAVIKATDYSKAPLLMNHLSDISLTKPFIKQNVVECLLNCKFNTPIGRKFLNNNFSQESYNKLLLIKILMKKDFNYDKVCKLLDKNISLLDEKVISYETLNFLVESLSLWFTQDEVLLIISQEDSQIHDTYYFNDIAYQLKEASLLDMPKERFRSSLPSLKWRDIHDYSSELMSLYSNKNKVLPVPKTLKELTGQQFREYTLFVPKVHGDLVTAGMCLSICVGNGQYSQKILENKSYIVLLKDMRNNFAYCLEIADDKIIQAMGKFNRKMDEELLFDFSQSFLMQPKNK